MRYYKKKQCKTRLATNWKKSSIGGKEYECIGSSDLNASE